jgi:uncharacterized sporulation protein YeaH/YhbH (DUF444 family)
MALLEVLILLIRYKQTPFIGCFIYRIYLIQLYQYNRHSTLMTEYRHLVDPKFSHFAIREKSHVYHALKHFCQLQERGHCF